MAGDSFADSRDSSAAAELLHPVVAQREGADEVHQQHHVHLARSRGLQVLEDHLGHGASGSSRARVNCSRRFFEATKKVGSLKQQTHTHTDPCRPERTEKEEKG